MSEAFIYLWYDAPNRMYYLGKHKGSPDDTYTHSSSIWKHFTKDNIPEGVTREILGEGTDEEMCMLEHELLVTAKNGDDWDMYYNNSLGDPRYVDQSRENNSQWIDGRWANDPKAWRRAYDATPERKAQVKKYQSTPEGKAKQHRYDVSSKGMVRSRISTAKYSAKKRAEAQGEGTLEKWQS